MSFVGAALPQFVLVLPDKRLLDEAYAGAATAQPPVLVSRSLDTSDAVGIGDFRSPWWPAASGVLSDSGIGDVLSASWRESVYPSAGCNGRLAFVGVTRDSYGSPLAGCTVRCFLTSTCELVSTVISDGNGAYAATTPYAGGHFLTVHKTASPDVAGASVDTLIAS